MTRTAVVRCDDYKIDNLIPAMESMIGSTDFPDVRGKKVFIKPNILSDSPREKAITTDPAVLDALIVLLKRMEPLSIMAGDSPGMQTGKLSAEKCGIAEVLRKHSVPLVDFREDNREHRISGISIPMAAVIDDADIVISVAKFKTHQLMMATGAVKNMFGLVPGMNKSPLHLRARNPESFSELLINIFAESKTSYAIIDGVIGMEGHGPANGTPRHIGLLIGGASAYAVDKAEATIMGYRTTFLLSKAEELMPGITDSDYPLLNPEDLVIRDFARISDGKKTTVRTLFIPSILSYLGIRKDPRPFPVFNKKRCKHCMKCINVCPAKAIAWENDRIVLDKSKCIRCYCCHEMCPFDAINVK